MYIRRKVFSCFEDEAGEARYFSTTEYINEEVEQREFNVASTKIANAAKGLKGQGFLFPEGAAAKVIKGSKGKNWKAANTANMEEIIGLKQARAAKKGQTLSRWDAASSLKGITY